MIKGIQTGAGGGQLDVAKLMGCMQGALSNLMSETTKPGGTQDVNVVDVINTTQNMIDQMQATKVSTSTCSTNTHKKKSDVEDVTED